MKYFFIILFGALLSTEVQAQIDLTGKVLDQEDLPLIGANIYLPELAKGSTTDLQGNFKIEGLPIGRFKVQVSYIGYQHLLKSVVVSDETQKLLFVLSKTVIESEQVVISGGHISSQHQNTVKIDVLKKTDLTMDASPGLMNTLTKIAGVDMISKGLGVAKPVIRGLSANDVLVLNNGVRIENYQYSENHPLGVDDGAVQTIEIIKGPASLIYGSDAIGGVINFIKEKAPTADGIETKIKTQVNSNTRGIKNNINIKGKSGSLSGSLNIGNKSHQDYRQGGGDFVANSRFNELNLSANIGINRKKGVYKVFYDQFRQKLGMTVPPAIALIDKAGRKNDYWFQDLKHDLLSSQNNIYLGKYQLKLNLAMQNALRKLQTIAEAPAVEMELKTYTLDSRLHLPSRDSYECIVGFQGMIQNNQNLNDRASQFLPDAHIMNVGIFTSAWFEFSNALRLQGGARYDNNIIETFELGELGEANYLEAVDKQFNSFSGSLGLTFNPLEKIHFRANFARAFRVPNLSELTSNGLHGNRYELGNSALEAQKANELDVSMHFHGNFLTLDAGAFYNKINKYIYIKPTLEKTEQGLDIYIFNQQNAYLYGGEASIHFHPKKMPYLHLSSVISNVTGKQDNGDYLPFIPSSKIRNEIRFQIKKLGVFTKPHLKFESISSLKQDHPSPFESITPSYNVFNFSLYSEFRINELKLNSGLSFNNILDTEYIDHLSTLKSIGYSSLGRNIALTLSVQFSSNKESR